MNFILLFHKMFSALNSIQPTEGLEWYTNMKNVADKKKILAMLLGCCNFIGVFLHVRALFQLYGMCVSRIQSNWTNSIAAINEREAILTPVSNVLSIESADLLNLFQPFNDFVKFSIELFERKNHARCHLIKISLLAQRKTKLDHHKLPNCC